MTSGISDRIHIGRKIVRLRELRGMKQETLAGILGVSQQTISKIEQSEEVEEERLQNIANALGVTPEAIRAFNEDVLFHNINNTFHDNASLINYQFNTVEKIVELYERLLNAEREKIVMLEKLINK